MRVLVVFAALLLAIGVLALRSGAPPVEAARAAAGRGGRDATHADRSPAERTPIDTPGTTETAVGPEAGPPRAGSAGHLTVLVLEHGSRRPLPEVAVRAWIRDDDRHETVELAVGHDGRASVDARALRDADSLSFEIRDPQLGWIRSVRPDRSIPELLTSREPFEILVPRGPWREFQVVAPDGAPVDGATLEEHTLRSAVTGPDGWSRVRMTAPPPRSVTVHAPGFRVESVPVPPVGEAWIIRLGRANRLEFALAGADDPRGYHVELRLPATMQQRTFFQSKYVQTPGRPVDGTPGHWQSLGHRGRSQWSLGFNSAGLAVVDQIYDGGTIDVELRRFDELLEARALVLPPEGGTVRVAFDVPTAPPDLVARVVDEAFEPVAGARVRAAPFGGRATIDLGGFPDFPAWAPAAETDADGSFRLPAPPDAAEVIVFQKRGLADRAMTVAEIRAHDHRVVLETGRTVVVEVRGPDDEILDGGWSSGMLYLHVRPSVHIGHDVWRDVSPRDHPAAALRDVAIPFFLFADLPSGVVTFRFTYVPADEILRHDTRFPSALFVSSESLSELMIGK